MPGHSLKYLITRCQAAYNFHSGIVEGFFFSCWSSNENAKGGKTITKNKKCCFDCVVDILKIKMLSQQWLSVVLALLYGSDYILYPKPMGCCMV